MNTHKKLLILLGTAFFFCLNACNVTHKAQNQKHSLQNIKTPKKLQHYFRFTGNNIPIISGHRGGAYPGYPENCIATFEHVLNHTSAFFEVDPRLTKDSVIVLMHDATLNRTTNGTGKVADYTWKELQKLKLTDVNGNVTEFGIPTLDEAIKWSKGKTVLNLDKKDVPLEMIARKIKQHHAEAHVMITVHNAKQAKFYYEDNPQLMFSAFVKTKEALEKYEKAGIPWSHIIAYIGSTLKPENKKMYKLLHNRGVMCMVSAAPVYDKLEDSLARKDAYRAFIKEGADIIESDLPIETAAAIRDLSPKNSKKEQYFKQGD